MKRLSLALVLILGLVLATANAAEAASPTQAPPEPTPPLTDRQPEEQPESEAGVAAILGNVKAVTAGLSHTCALTTNGSVLCWGDNAYGQLGNGARTYGAANPYPRRVGALSEIQAIAAGDAHTCALTKSGGVKCWGSNAEGQLGDGTTATRLSPVYVNGLTKGVQAIAGGQSQTCALTTGGGVKCWGNLVTTPLDVQGLTSNVIAIAGGYRHMCALVGASDTAQEGGVQCWGANDTGQLGNGKTTPSASPVQVSGLAGGVKALAAGGAPLDRFRHGGHTCALLTDGSVKCWGWNAQGQLGDGTNLDRLTPVTVGGLANVQDIAAGDEHTCALTGDIAGGQGALRCWGANRYGQLGVGTTTSYSTPVQVGGFTSGVRAVAAGGAHTCGVTAANRVKCWGINVSGQLGNFTLGSQSLLPEDVLVPDSLTYLPQVMREE
jgi:alpha-tubulin suppressor-like RCC1 family protein